MHRRVLMYAWTSAYICKDSCLCLPGRNLTGERLVHNKFIGPDSLTDELLLHISNGNHINTIMSAPTGLSCTRTGIVYMLSFTSEEYWYHHLMNCNSGVQ